MAKDDLPMPVVNFLNVIGVKWPYVNEDTVMQFASLVRDFGTVVQTTHQDATAAVKPAGEAYQGAASEQMKSGWDELSSRHVTEILDGCAVLSVALEGAAGYIVAQKVEAVADLVGMAGAFVADQAAAVATFGIAEAAVPLIIEGAEQLVDSLAMDLQQYIMGKVIGEALKPLINKITQAVSGLDWSRTTPIGGSSSGFSLDEAALRAQTALLRTHAQTMRSHAMTFRQGIAGLSF
ncbi:MAG: hypothetical protein ACRDRL_12820 [Sciscionella sp.]